MIGDLVLFVLSALMVLVALVVAGYVAGVIAGLVMLAVWVGVCELARRDRRRVAP